MVINNSKRSSTESRKSLLFVTSTPPLKGGLGVAMRAGNHLEVLSERFDVTVLLVNQGSSSGNGQQGFDYSDLATSVSIFDRSRIDSFFDMMTAPTMNSNLRLLFSTIGPILPRPSNRLTRSHALKSLATDRRFDGIFAFRLRTAPIAWACRELLRAQTGHMLLDTDEIESDTRLRFAEAFKPILGRSTYWSRRIEALRYRRAEKRWFPKFDKILVCSSKDRDVLSARYPGLAPHRFHVLPNAVRMPSAPLPWPVGREPTLLFVGSMTYQPNCDAIRYFCEEILPLLRNQVPVFKLWVVGRNPPPDIVNLQSKNHEMAVTGTVPDVTEFYARSHVAIVPLRTGGGTRIKILEAMSFGRPVVSTSMGAEGLELTSGNEIIIADDPKTFAAQCAMLLRNEMKARELARKAFSRCGGMYSLTAIKQQFNAVYNQMTT